MLTRRVPPACLFLFFVFASTLTHGITAQSPSPATLDPQQAQPQAAPPTTATKDYEFTCPGSFPSDLTIVNCNYLPRQRLQQFITTGLTDQAMLLSITGSVFTTAIRTPGEWPGTWKYYGYRVGASYTQSIGNNTAQYIVGAVLHEDPRHVRCDDDPLLYHRNPATNDTSQCTAGQRFGHFLLDSITVRHSDKGVYPLSGDRTRPLDAAKIANDPKVLQRIAHGYRRLPAFSRLIGAYAGAYAQYPWEPRSANTFGAISQRAALAFAPTFLGSLYTEYSTSVISALKKGKH